MSDRTNRRLAAILALDVVGFSRLMGSDEVGTLRRLNVLHKELVHPCVVKHGGRIVKLMGDGLLAEFASVIKSVECASDIQTSILGFESDIPDDQSIKLRIGVNLGDIIVEGSDIFGDGVNIAARLESLAKPGGICISGKVHDEVRDRLQEPFEDMGDQDVKNINRPVRVWRWNQHTNATPAPNSGAAKPSRFPNKPTIAVLPFDNMSSDNDQDYFADGIAEDITTELSRFGSLFVVSRHSAFKYRGDGLDLTAVGKELGAHFLLEGSVRRGGNRVRVTVQLIDSESGSHIWAERFDRSIEDIFAIQDEITETVASTVAGQVQIIGTDRAKQKNPESLEAYDFFLQGLDLHKGGQPGLANAKSAVSFFDKAIELDDSFARAYAWRACSSSRTWIDGPTEEGLDECFQTVKTALSLDENESETHRILGAIYLIKRDYERAEKHIKRAALLNPNDADIAAKSASFYSYAGRPEEALASVQRGMSLNPLHGDWYWTELGLAHFVAGDCSAAIDALSHSASPTILDLALLAASCVEEDRLVEARSYADELAKAEPGVTTDRFKKSEPFRRVEDIERLTSGLQKAGIPDQ